MHDITIVVTLAAALGVALLFGWITQRFGLSTLVGYLLAGVIVGPYTPGFVADATLASRLAEIGVILLMFGVGMHFDVAELWAVRRIAIPGAVVQSSVAGVLGWALARAFGWSDIAGAIFGMSLAVASTAVLTRMLIDFKRLSTYGGHVAIGWLIVEDVFTVLALVALPALAAGQEGGLAPALGLALAKAGAFAVILWLVGMRVVTNMAERVARTGSEELFTVAVFVVALGVAAVAAGVFEVSVALGAFFAGLVVGRSRIGAQAAAYMNPFRDVFAALFFVSVGMLFDPSYVLKEPVKVIAAVLIVLVAKPLAALLIVRWLAERPGAGGTIGVGLAQIGEFSFLLGALGVSLGVFPREGMDLLITTALVTIALNPLLFTLLERREGERASAPVEGVAAPAAALPLDPAGERVLVCGGGPLQRMLVRSLREDGVDVRVVEHDLDKVEAWLDEGVVAVFGDPSRPEVLRAAATEGSSAIVVTSATLPARMAVCVAARAVAGAVPIVAVAADPSERAWLEEFGVAAAVDVATPAAQAALVTLAQVRRRS
jgi:CPA2 family monovalent cation:H+ antiporter-2